MFRRKDEGTENAAETNAPVNPAASAPAASAEVQVPPAAQGQSETPSQPYGSASSSYAPPASTGYGNLPAEAKSAAAATSSSPAYASPYRATTGSTSASSSSGSAAAGSGSNVTELSGRSTSSNAPSSRYADNATRTGTSSMEKPAKSANASKNRILTVGNDILMKGEINSCDRIVIEGAVDATLKEVHTMEIAETGSFKGIAEVEEAEISGTVEGDLTVRGRLIIYSTGKVSGKISYGEIEVERGGQITGEIKTAGASSSSSATTKAAA